MLSQETEGERCRTKPAVPDNDGKERDGGRVERGDGKKRGRGRKNKKQKTKNKKQFF